MRAGSRCGGYLDRYHGEERTAFILLSPVLIYLLLVMVFPICWAVYLSMTTVQKGETDYVGLSNYLKILQDPSFYNSLLRTMQYTFYCVAGKVIIGVIWAVILNQPFRMKSLYRALLILPWSIPTVIAILTWRWMYSDAGGVLSYLVQLTGLTSKRIFWLSSPNMAMLSVVMANIWRGVPFVGISVLSGLQTLPASLDEAAMIDGANTVQRFFYVTLPQISGVIVLAGLVTCIWTINDFELVYLLTGGGPAKSTEILSVYSYNVGFKSLNVSKAIASTVLTMPLMMALVELATRRALKTKE